MIAMMLAVILVLIAKVLPVFHQIYMELGSDLTGFAGAMMRFSDALNQYLFVIVIVLIAAAAGIFLISKSDAGQKFFKKRPLALSTAASRFEPATLPPEAHARTLVLHGEKDDTVPLQSVMDWARPQILPVTVIPDGGHFFHGQLPLLKGLVARHLSASHG